LNRFHDIWGGGQLLAFSGIDGRTDFENGLCLRTAFSGFTFELKHTGSSQDAKIRYTGAAPDRIELTGDIFRFHSKDGVSSGVLADAWNLLLEGDFSFEPAPRYESVASGRRTVVAVKGFLDAALLDADMEQLISRRDAWLAAAPLPAGASEETRRTAVKAWSQLKTQIYSPEGQIKTRWSTPDRWPHKNMWLWTPSFTRWACAITIPVSPAR